MENKKKTKFSALTQLESNIKNKTTESTKSIEPVQEEKPEIITDDAPTVLNKGKKQFQDFFESTSKTKNAEKITIDTEVKNILSRLTVNAECSTMSLASNILRAWIEDNKLNIEKFLREQSKLKF